MWDQLTSFVESQMGVSVILAFVIVQSLLGITAYCIYFERKIAAWIQDRPGPNRVGPYGLLQLVADGLKFAAALRETQTAPVDAGVEDTVVEVKLPEVPETVEQPLPVDPPLTLSQQIALPKEDDDGAPQPGIYPADTNDHSWEVWQSVQPAGRTANQLLLSVQPGAKGPAVQWL